jgi:hypothetical protein
MPKNRGLFMVAYSRFQQDREEVFSSAQVKKELGLDD